MLSVDVSIHYSELTDAMSCDTQLAVLILSCMILARHIGSHRQKILMMIQWEKQAWYFLHTQWYMNYAVPVLHPSVRLIQFTYKILCLRIFISTSHIKNSVHYGLQKKRPRLTF